MPTLKELKQSLKELKKTNPSIRLSEYKNKTQITEAIQKYSGTRPQPQPKQKEVTVGPLAPSQKRGMKKEYTLKELAKPYTLAQLRKAGREYKFNFDIYNKPFYKLKKEEIYNELEQMGFDFTKII